MWFIEHIPSQKWLDNDLKNFTDEPQKAKKYKSKMEATTEIVTLCLGKDFQATEHSFDSGFVL